MSVSSNLLCSFELLKPLDSSALKSHIKRGRNARQNMLNSPVSIAVWASMNKLLTILDSPPKFRLRASRSCWEDRCVHAKEDQDHSYVCCDGTVGQKNTIVLSVPQSNFHGAAMQRLDSASDENSSMLRPLSSFGFRAKRRLCGRGGLNYETRNVHRNTTKLSEPEKQVKIPMRPHRPRMGSRRVGSIEK
jgi:hypothetical protein